MWKIVLPLLVIVGAIWASVSSDTASSRTDLTFVNRGDVTSLDLQTISWMQDLRVARVVFEGLVRPDIFSSNYAPTPAVAKSWTVSPSGTHYTFKLRSDAKWSNGKPVLPSHFIYAWRRALLPETGSDYIAQFQFLKGGEEFTRWRNQAIKAHALKVKSGELSLADALPATRQLWEETCRKFNEIVQVRGDDTNLTLDVDLERPCSYFLDLCGFPQLYPVYPPLLDSFMLFDAATGTTKIDQSWCKPGSIISNGPFQLALWRFKRDMQFTQNPFWWNQASLNIRTISVPTIEDPNGQVLAFRSGAVDWLSDVDVSQHCVRGCYTACRWIGKQRDVWDFCLAQQG
jgi:oligopeptide transport system substrate-binding protein